MEYKTAQSRKENEKINFFSQSFLGLNFCEHFLNFGLIVHIFRKLYGIFANFAKKYVTIGIDGVFGFISIKKRVL